MVKQLTINRTSWMEFRDCLEKLEPFDTYGNLSGHKVTTTYLELGQLPKPYRGELDERASEGQIDYIVYSYATPIAWHDKELGWVMPDVKYSTTTSKAQGRIAPAVASLQQTAQSQIKE